MSTSSRKARNLLRQAYGGSFHLESFCFKNEEFHLLRDPEGNYGVPYDDAIEFTLSRLASDGFLEALEEHLQSKHARSIHIKLVPEFSYSYENISILLSSRYTIFPSFAQLIDLSKSKENLKSDIRKGSKSCINKELQRINFKSYSKQNPDEKLLSLWKNLYSSRRLRGGRITSEDVFINLRQEILLGNGLLVLAFESELLLGGAYFHIYEGHAYYDAGANIDAIEQDRSRGVGHALIWKGILELKEQHSCLSLEFAPIFFNNQIHQCPSEKEINISRFKTGFGGALVPLYYFSKTYSDRSIEPKNPNVLL